MECSDGHRQVKCVTKIWNENEYNHADWTCVYVYKSTWLPDTHL